MLQEYDYMRMRYDETLAEFLARYHKVWEVVKYLDISGVDGIIHLIHLLPAAWREWAVSLVASHVGLQYLEEYIHGDCNGFIATISRQFMREGAPPPGPYYPPQRIKPSGLRSEAMPQDDPIPFLIPSPSRPEPSVRPQLPARREPVYATRTWLPGITPTVDYDAPVSQPDAPVSVSRSFFAATLEVVPYELFVASFLQSTNDEEFFRQHRSVPSSEFESGSSRPRCNDSDSDDAPLTEQTVGKGHLQRISSDKLSFDSTAIGAPLLAPHDEYELTLDGEIDFTTHIRHYAVREETPLEDSFEEPAEEEEEEDPEEDSMEEEEDPKKDPMEDVEEEDPSEEEP